MLIGFVVPRLFASTSRIPASSSTARTPPPAITPVPSLAGRRTTRAASNLPVISCVIVAPCFGHGEEVLLRVVDGLRDRERDLARLPVADADAVDLVADHDERGEREPPAALDDLRDAVDLDHALLELARLGDLRHPSELQPSLACALGEGLHASVVEVTRPVEDARLDAGLLRGLGERLADGLGLLGLRALERALLRASSRRRACGRPRRRRAGRRCRGSSGRRRAAAARPCPRSCRAPAGDGGGALRER